MKRYLFLFLFFLNACVTSPLPAGEGGGVRENPTSNELVMGSDPEMESAFAEARATLDEFITRIAELNPTREFVALKVRFTLPDASTQDIWCDEAAYENSQFTGNMGDDISSLKLAFGDRITISNKNIVDWMIVQDGKLIGGFTIRVAFSRMTPAEKEFFLNDAGYSIEE